MRVKGVWGIGTCDWNSAESEVSFNSSYIRNGVIRTEYNRIRDKPILKLLHLSHHFGLFIGRTIMMNHTKSTK
jgi:hypothetical protein